MTRRFDAVVVGGGPVGCLVARKLASRGHSVAVLEEHSEIGLPVHCGGLVSPRALRFLPQSVRANAILANVHGARIHPPTLKPFEVRSRELKAVVIDRSKFDRCFASSAADAGADINPSTRVVRFGRSDDMHIAVTSTGEEIVGRILIGADGVSSNVARAFGFPRVGEVIPSCGCYLDNDHDKDSTVDVYVGSKVAPGFFAWTIPGMESVNVGLGTRRGIPPRPYLKRFLKMTGFDGDRSRMDDYSSGIPIGPRARTVKGSVALVGDAAGHAKPMSGGGIFTGLRCASILADIASESLEAEGEPDLSGYEAAWRRAIGKELARGMRLRRIYLNMNDRHMDDICRIFGSSGILSVINENGDIDYPSRLVLPLLRRAPSLAKFAGPLLKSLI